MRGVRFYVLDDNNAEDRLPHYAAAEKRNIGFEFQIMTPIKGGYVRFSIPSSSASGGWAQPRHTDVVGTARVKLHSRNACRCPCPH